MRNEKYIAAINTALLSFQMIEEALKICVGLSYEVIGATTPPPIVFRFDSTVIMKAPLERLINMFSTVSANGELVKDLRKVIEWRNYCAHNAFVHEFLESGSKSPFKPHPVEDIHVIIKFAAILVERLGGEILTIRATHAVVTGENHERGRKAGT